MSSKLLLATVPLRVRGVAGDGRRILSATP
jgi:hypothetical protein